MRQGGANRSGACLEQGHAEHPRSGLVRQVPPAERLLLLPAEAERHVRGGGGAAAGAELPLPRARLQGHALLRPGPRLARGPRRLRRRLPEDGGLGQRGGPPPAGLAADGRRPQGRLRPLRAGRGGHRRGPGLRRLPLRAERAPGLRRGLPLEPGHGAPRERPPAAAEAQQGAWLPGDVPGPGPAGQQRHPLHHRGALGTGRVRCG
mmetsp:Transcript_7868/g.22247  ORF Transcript_7868/g.22247 Transcript_7868/m.22247 type:complete len:206 (-) Transcript_7868:219-836(-)